jgi:hypothetical protein
MATSAGLAWSLANGITQEEYDKNLVNAYKDAVAKGLTDAQIESGMNQWGISAADLARATVSDVGKIEARMEAATPTTPAEIATDTAAKAELATRQGLADAQTKANEAAWAAKQKQNEIDWAAKQKQNEIDFAAQQKANAAAEAARLAGLKNDKVNPFINAGPLTPPAGGMNVPTVPFTNAPQSLAQNFQNYQSIPIGAQYNPNVVGGTGSPYSQIMGQMRPVGNPYADVVSGQAMGGYNPALYDQIAASNAANKAVADAAALLNPNLSGDSGGDGGTSGGGSGVGTGAGAGTGNAMAKGGYVHGGLMFGPNPPGPDDGAVNLDLGEYVIKKSSVKKYGRGLLDMINEGKIPAKKIRSLLD